MKTEIAKQAAELIMRINEAEKKIEYLNILKNVSSVQIIGGDENSREYKVCFYSITDKVFIDYLHDHIEQYLMNEVNNLNDKLRQL